MLIGGIERLRDGLAYPDFERRNGVEGRVIVAFVVDVDGVAWGVTVARGVSPGLDAAAVEAVRAARFTPGQRNGRPVAVRFTLPVTFRTGARGDGVPATTSGYP
jgi:TonB family protein